MTVPTVLITGAASGIGYATAEAFAEQGANLVLADADAAAGNASLQRIRAHGGQAMFLKTDVTDTQQVARLVKEAVAAFGRIDYAVNNAGIEGQRGTTVECSEENWARVLAVTLTGVWRCMKHEIPQMLAQGGGAIVNVSSAAGLAGLRQFPAYAASKHGILGLTKTAALEYAKQGIRVNAVCPGYIDTAMVARQTSHDPKGTERVIAQQPIGRLGRPAEVASAIQWLCSERASFTTGHALAVDGGLTAQ